MKGIIVAKTHTFTQNQQLSGCQNLLTFRTDIEKSSRRWKSTQAIFFSEFSDLYKKRPSSKKWWGSLFFSKTYFGNL